MNRSKVYFFIFVSVILAMVALQLELHRKMDRRSSRAEPSSAVTVESLIKPVSPKIVVVEKSAERKKLDATVSPEFIEQLKQESGQVGLPQNNVEALENRLQSWARHLDKNEIDYLSAVIKDRMRNGDERALALDLLGRNQSSESLAHLKDFVLSEGGGGSSRARADEEMIFKVQAVEEIAASSSSAEAISYLSEIQKKTDQSFVKDRAQRSLSSLKGLAPSPESQDNEALKKTIE